MEKMWIDADYWAVFDEQDNELFRGSKTACHKYEKKHGGKTAHVILELREINQPQ